MKWLNFKPHLPGIAIWLPIATANWDTANLDFVYTEPNWIVCPLCVGCPCPGGYNGWISSYWCALHDSTNPNQIVHGGDLSVVYGGSNSTHWYAWPWEYSPNVTSCNYSYDVSCNFNRLYNIASGDILYYRYYRADSQENIYFACPVPIGNPPYNSSNTTGWIYTPTIVISPTTNLLTYENGATTSFTVALYSQPQADVQLDLSSSDLTEGTVSPISFTFTSSNWASPQTVTITGQDDTLIDGHQTYTIVLVTTSTDSNYNDIEPVNVPVINIDNELTPILTINKIGTGIGTVTSNPTGINCGTTCSANFAAGTSVTLTAAAATGSAFGGWGGACTGTATTCTLDVNADKGVNATFNSSVPTTPTCTTADATEITGNSAKLNGSVVSSGATATASFDFGSTTAYGTSVAATPSSVYSSTPVAVSANKTGLTSCTTYHYRVTAVNSAGTCSGAADKTFTTVTSGLCGDADSNKVVNIVDALAIARKVVGLPAPPPVNACLADVNKNGNVDINDALFIAKYSIGLTSTTGTCALGQPL